MRDVEQNLYSPRKLVSTNSHDTDLDSPFPEGVDSAEYDLSPLHLCLSNKH